MSRSSFSIFAVLAMGVLAWPSAAWANYPTPSQQLGLAHGFVLNPLLGLACGWLIARACRTGGARARLVMMAGVTGAMWATGLVAWVWLMPWWEAQDKAGGDLPIDSAWRACKLLSAAWIAGFAVLMVPVAGTSLDRAHRTRRNWGKAYLIAVGVNVGLMGAWYGLTCNARLMRFERVDPAVIAGTGTTGIGVYYISGDDGKYWRVSLDGKTREVVSESHAFVNVAWTNLYLQDSTQPETTVLGLLVIVQNTLSSDRAEMFAKFPTASVSRYNRDVTSYNPAVFATAATNRFEVRPDAGTRGLRMLDKKPPHVSVLGMDVPFLAWNDMDQWREREPSYVTAIGGDLCVCQFGSQAGTIVLLDPVNRRYGVLAHGFAPIVSSAKPAQVEVSP